MATSVRQLIKRRKNRLHRDTSRVITRTHIPTNFSRIKRIADRVLLLQESHAADLLKEVLASFSSRHKNIELSLAENFKKVCDYIDPEIEISYTKQILIGAYFTMEYSVESAALFNPSIVPHPNQSGLESDELRFIMSLRATGEGHISSIVFRTGLIEDDGAVVFDSITDYLQTPKMIHDPYYMRDLFQMKLQDMGVWDDTSIEIIERLPDVFTFNDLTESILRVHQDTAVESDEKTLVKIKWLANSNYKIRFDSKSKVSERVIFPVSENESRGIEDARFVRFADDDGEITYYATYTAYNGFNILPQLIETKDFLTFNIITLNGMAVQNKGMALFPRKINGKYVMLGRQDGENNYIMYSDHLHFWQEAILIQEPQEPWEFIQIGNCGSPIEISEGWLVLTHGVGAMRQYFMGALLLDLNDPSKVIARLHEPLLSPTEEEREGYVPNVIYSCGALIHNNRLVIPYAMSDITSGIATIKVDDLLKCMDRV